MARTMAAALEAVARAEGRRFEYVVGLAVPPRRQAPVEPEISRAFATVEGRYLKRVVRRVCAGRADRWVDAEEAVAAALLDLFQSRRELFREDPTNWEALLCKCAYYRLIEDGRRAQSCGSLDFLVEVEDDATLSRAELCTSLSSSAAEDSRYVPQPAPGKEWSAVQAMGAFQRFRDDHGRPPKARECGRRNGLPSMKTISRLFGTLNAAVLEAGMVPQDLGRRKRSWTPTEAARICRTFYRWRGWWPERSDLLQYPGFLPSPSVADRVFGSTRSGVIRRRAEAILAYAEARS